MSNATNPTTSLTEICNLSLAIIGHNRINNIDVDEQEWSRTIRDVIYEVIKDEQCGFYWPELKKQITLVRAEEQPEDTRYINYNIPTDMLQIIRLTDNTPWILLGDYLQVDSCNYTNYNTNAEPTLEYIRYSDNPSEWSTYLRECIYTKLAMYIAMPITQNSNIASYAAARYESALGKRNRAFKSGTAPIRRRRGTDWNNSRYFRGRYSDVATNYRNNLRF